MRAVGAASRLRYQEPRGLLRIVIRIVLVVSLWEMRIRPLNLDEAFAANGLVAAAGVVQVWRVRQEADRTFGSVLVEENFERLSVDKGVVG